MTAFDPTEAYGTAMTTVQAFYLALAAGNGDEAARFVIPQKRIEYPIRNDGRMPSFDFRLPHHVSGSLFLYAI
jgi:hypothetical protein